ncbi:PREDICTED: FGFR1 oncogene partner-like isoform X1 [Branchiostoma belcheri]|uniref:Centrosomal protein 43 n=1 Tax=Branchiostoma belcheri TaxID=7741 RepID=A0A6P5AL39_BRABE|nr:PREDICTED: FGFR1 oncogene partner-like isoform X1 [Branchiostoma belcheri]
MSADEDTELRDLVAQTLETNGVLGKIRAQLRASVFLALEEQGALESKSQLVNQDLKKFLNTKEGRMVAALVREFLIHFNLDYSLAVFDPETNFGEKYEGRDALARELNILESDDSSRLPLLTEVVKRMSSSGAKGRSLASPETGDVRYMVPKDLTAKQVEDAKKKFNKYDADKNGYIDKDEMRQLFLDMFPHFNRNMLDRYVNDEFRAQDKDFSNTIDFDEFLGMYKRLFVLCRSVVASDVSDITLSSPRVSSPDNKSSFTKVDKNAVEAKNRKNQEVKQASGRSTDFRGDDFDLDDDFFDKPVPSENKFKFSSDNKDKDSGFSSAAKSDKKPTGGAASSGLSSLSGAPSLAGTGKGSLTTSPLSSLKEGGNRSPDWRDLEAIDNKIKDLGFEVPNDDDDYEDDFASQSQSQSGAHSVSEEIEEEISIEADDLLNDSQEKFDDLTEDRTVSQASVGGFDYAEDVQLSLTP